MPTTEQRSGRQKAPGKLAVIGVLLAGAMGLAACGSGGNAASTGANTSPSGGASGASSPSATGLLAKIERTHQLSIAISAYAPQDYQGKNGSWTGYDVDILKGFAKTLGAKLAINSMPLSPAVEAVSTHRDDITIDIYYTKTRAQKIAFSRPMLNYKDAVAVNASNPAVTSNTVSALSGKKVAVVVGSAEVSEAQKIPHATVKKYSNIAESFLALSSGRVDADLQPDVDISWKKHKNPSLNIKILGPVPASIAPPVASLRGYYGVPKGAYGKQFLAKLNAYLKKIACDGSEQKILNKYNMSNSIYLKGICSAPNTYSGSG